MKDRHLFDDDGRHCALLCDECMRLHLTADPMETLLALLSAKGAKA